MENKTTQNEHNSTMETIPIVKAKNIFGAEFLYIKLSKRKAWNLLLKQGGIICANKRYIKHNDLYWHNNRLMPYLICTEIKGAKQ